MTTCQIKFSTNNGTLRALFNDSDDGLKILSCNTFFKNKKLPTYQTFNILLLLFSKKNGTYLFRLQAYCLANSIIDSHGQQTE